jgi:diguanylate cyclase (GGDEF)-like protein
MPHRPLRQSATARILAAVATRIADWPRQRVWVIAWCALILIILINRLAGPYVSLLALYMVLATFAGWRLGEGPGFLFATLCVASGLIMRRIDIGKASVTLDPLPADLINAFGRLLTIMFAVAVVSGLRAARDMERWRGSIDALTGALNKVAFEENMQLRLREAARHGHAVVLAYVDLDGFKRVNDTFRHAAGDRLLADFAAGALASLRAGDLFARVGGDEFAALLTARDAAEGAGAGEALHHRLCRILRDQGLGVTCSTGAVVMTPDTSTEGSDLLEAADRLMYGVKAEGKNGLRLEVIPVPNVAEARGSVLNWN